MQICKECQKEFRSIVALVAHISSIHNKKEYYDKWVKKEDEGICKNCGNPTNFSGRWNRGYNNFCCNRCKYEYVNNDPVKIKKGNNSVKTYYQEKYGVNHYTQTDEFKNKAKKSKKERYGVENYFNIEKSKKTKNERYGDPNWINIDKIKATNLEKYGGISPMHSKEIFDKVEKNSYKSKKHFCGINYRGKYEEDFLNNFSQYYDIKNPNGISYTLDEKDKIYYPDFYIPLLNLMIEIKNSYLFNRDLHIIKAKEKACINAGFKYIIIIDKDYTEFKRKYLSA